jgi:hypothetical protein
MMFFALAAGAFVRENPIEALGHLAQFSQQMVIVIIVGRTGPSQSR